MKNPSKRQDTEAMYVSALFPPREAKKERLLIALTASEKNRIEELSARLGITQSALMRRAVEVLFEMQEPDDNADDVPAGMTRR